ncbi:MAG TPA: 5'-deoxynucleotidase [Ruminococcaceae bacterium]|nr:5'-deoxynucleotidase [Oscillospiraceae bacterium]
MSHRFFAMLSRMKYINRWALMRNTRSENLSEHSLEVSAIAHALAVLSNERFGTELNAERTALLGLYHDMPEIITGDMPTPIKYGNDELRMAYKAVEHQAAERLVALLPQDMQKSYRRYFIKQDEDRDEWRMVKAADKISALIKCIEEEKAGNTEFVGAKESIEKLIAQLNCPPADCFIEEFISSYHLNLDELQQKDQNF